MRSKMFYVAVLAGLLAFATVGFCQTAIPPLRNVSHILVKPDHVQDFLDVQRQIAESFRKAALPGTFRIVYRTAVGNQGEFWIVTPMSKYADRDGENPYNKMATEVDRLVRSVRLSQYVERSQSSIEQTIPDLTVIPTGAKVPAAFLRLTRTRIRPGTANDYINVLKTEVVPVAKKISRSASFTSRVAWGGSQNEFVGANGFEKWAELDDTTTFQQAAGGDQAVRRISEKLTQFVTSSERFILSYQPDLSYYPAAAATAAGR